jgi:phosphate:Na+ symporter
MDTNRIKNSVISMAEKMCDMVDLVSKGFMEHKPEFLAGAMKIEGEINTMEKALTKDVLELFKNAKSEPERKDLIALEQAVEMLERMGDEASSLVERIEIKNAEHLLFSERGVEEFNETYDTMRKSLVMMRDFLKGKDSGVKDRIIENGFRVKELVERYRAEHTERLVRGMCTPMGANMYFDMLDFTGNLARHASNVVKLFCL